MINYKINQELQGTIVGIQPYGLFVQLDEQTQGLVHVSECKLGIVNNIKTEFKVGQKVDVRILDIDLYCEKISLSLKQNEILKLLKPNKDVHVNEIKKHYWTNHHLDLGFKELGENREIWIKEALEKMK